MVMKKEAKRVNADDQWVKSLHTSDKEGLESSQSLKWHVCVSCEAKQTGKTRDQVMDSDFKKQTEHKLNRVAKYKEHRHRLKRQKRILILSDLVAKGKAPAVARNDVEDDKVTLSEGSGEKASTPEVHSVTNEGEWEELRRTLPDPEDPLVAMDINKVLLEAKAQDSYIPASSYQEEPVSSKDSTCSCNSSLQILAACFTCSVVRV